MTKNINFKEYNDIKQHLAKKNIYPAKRSYTGNQQAVSLFKTSPYIQPFISLNQQQLAVQIKAITTKKTKNSHNHTSQ